MEKKHLSKRHQEIFSSMPHAYYFSPGRVNLIGEHIDYCGGYVLPMAINVGTYACVSHRSDEQITVFSEQFSDLGVLAFDLRDIKKRLHHNFIDYIKGVSYTVQSKGYLIPHGLDIFIEGDMPTSAGLSSSASLELLMIQIISDQFGLDIDRVDMAWIGKSVENDYLGLSSGIMDQFAIAFGKKHHALYLNTQDITYQHVPFDTKSHVLVLMNTNKKRNLVDSDYNERVHAIGHATHAFQKVLDIKWLCDVSIEAFESNRHIINDPIILKRAQHVIYENARTKKAYQALKENDFQHMGQLMNASHDSLRDLYEVSCEELDYLVLWHRNMGALGARMTGAGFGGTMIALYDKNKLPKDFESLKQAYQQRFHLPIDIIITEAEHGVDVMKEEV